MIRTCCILAAALVLAGPSRAEPKKPATLEIKLPAEAKLFFNDKEMVRTGAVRTFTVPSLDPAITYRYDLRVEYKKGADTVVQRKTVRFKGGESVKLDFTAPADTASLPPPIIEMPSGGSSEAYLAEKRAAIIKQKQLILNYRDSLRTAERQDAANKAANDRIVEARKKSIDERDKEATRLLSERKLIAAALVQSLVENDKRDLYKGLARTDSAEVFRRLLLEAEQKLVALEGGK